MANVWLFVCLLCFGTCCCLLEQGLPSTPKLPLNEEIYFHQIIQQQTANQLEQEKQIASLHTSLFKLQEEVSRLKSNSTSIQQQETVVVSAYLSTTINNPHKDQIIVFDKTWVNTDNAYNTGSGVFTAPLSGIYSIGLTVASHMTNTHLHLRLNRQSIAYVISDIHHTGYYGRGTITLFHHMNKGDNLMVISTDDHVSNSVIGSNPPLSMFSIQLVQKD